MGGKKKKGQKRKRGERSSLSVCADVDIESLQAGASWDTAFKTAAAVNLEEVDDAFLARTSNSGAQDGLAAIVELKKIKQQQGPNGTKQCENAVDRPDEALNGADVEISSVVKLTAAPSPADDSPPASEPVLEGRMEQHPNGDGSMIPVLVDTAGGVVYSMTRNDAGQLVKLGCLDKNKNKDKDNGVLWDRKAILTMFGNLDNGSDDDNDADKAAASDDNPKNDEERANGGEIGGESVPSRTSTDRTLWSCVGGSFVCLLVCLLVCAFPPSTYRSRVLC